MRDPAPQKIRLADYRPFPYRIEETRLHFRLSPNETSVRSAIRFVPMEPRAGELVLDGEGLTLVSARVDGTEVEPVVTAAGLRVAVPDRPFLWEAEVIIDPASNTALQGLYMSNGMYCTQCEAEGFRRITYYPDRPDVMAPFHVTVESDLPVLLSNGNPVLQEPGKAVWFDPWPKPSYLFALVAGDLRSKTTEFTTRSGNSVECAVWVRPGDEDRTGFALEALTASMRWDEEVFDREYDLEIFNIVAVDDFNMGAMENKGLNIFNSKYVLASPETATDRDYELIEAIIAHEYFHNWTGNRITCRDWFQLCLKEGLTVYRDQQFTADRRSRAVKRIEDVQMLRSRQFREDAGPLAHPVRPEEYIEINNFYTATVYEKGAEIIGMLRLVVGEVAWHQGCARYFERHDGDAATIEDWLHCFEEVSGQDLSQFKLWYSQAGTPVLRVETSFEADRFRMVLSQHVPPTPGQDDKKPMVLPFSFGLLASDGSELTATQTVILTEATQEIICQVQDRPVLSALRGFSAPVQLLTSQTRAERLVLLAHDRDAFVRWEAGRNLAHEILREMLLEGTSPDPDYLAAFARMLEDDSADPAFRALAAVFPGEDEIAAKLHQDGYTPDPDKIYQCLQNLKHNFANQYVDMLKRIKTQMQSDAPYSPDPEAIGRRSLWRAALALLSYADGGAAAQEALECASNMTESLAALAALVAQSRADAALDHFAAQWSHDRLVMDKWFMLQLASCPPEQLLPRAKALLCHPDFDLSNPNRARSVLGALSVNHAGFHAADGGVYRLLGEWLAKLDALNPQTSARLSTSFETWKRYDAQRQEHAQAAMEALAARQGISRDLAEMLGRMLA